MKTTERNRLQEARTKQAPWKKWGPYLSERQWGTVREDYSESGDAWNYFTHDHARSRAYRWGEDGLAGISDDQQHGIQPSKANQRFSRNDRWGHMVNADVISMPDKWEYPWYAAWMALFCQNMLEIGAELAVANPAYINLACKFIEHFLLIASGMIRPSEEGGMWDEEDGFFYDVLRSPDRRSERLKVRSMVGLLPLCAVTIFEGKLVNEYPEVGSLMREYQARPELMAFIHDPLKRGYIDRFLGSILNEANLRRVLKIILDENEFLSPFGIRALSRIHQDQPYVYRVGDQEWRVSFFASF